MGISDWVWGTYINSSLTLLCVCWLVAWPHFIHSVRPESNKITLAEINWWLWRSFSRAVTFPNRSNVHSHFTLWSASFVEVREEAGFEVFSSLSLCSFFFLLSTRLNCFCHFPCECKTMNAFQERLNMWAAIHILKSYRVTFLRLLAFHPAFSFFAFFRGEWFCSQCNGAPFSINLWTGNQIWTKKQTVRFPNLLKTHKSEERME